MIKNDDKANLLDEKLMSIFDWNIPRKINFNSFVNNVSGNSFNDKYYNDKNCQNKISKFNPYDAEIDKKFKCKNEIRKVNNEINNDNNIIYFGFNSGEKNENKSIEDKFLIKKINNYINISSDEESNKIPNNNFNTPKLNIRNNNEYTKLTQYSINNNNEKDMWYTDLKNGLNNMKIKSTNFSSNVSYESYDKNENKNFVKDRNKKVTFIHVNRNNKNEKSLIDNRNKNKENKINKLIQSRIHTCKTLKTIDEYTGTKKSKKNSHSRCKEKKNNLSCIKIHVNRTNKKDKEKNKSKSKEKSKILNKMNLKKNNLNLRNEYKKKEKNNNDDKKGANIKDKNENNDNNIEDVTKKGKKKDSESIPKVKARKSFFNSFLCCFECLNSDNKNNDNSDNINKVPLTKLNTDINNKLKNKDKKSRNKSEKKKKK